MNERTVNSWICTAISHRDWDGLLFLKDALQQTDIYSTDQNGSPLRVLRETKKPGETFEDTRPYLQFLSQHTQLLKDRDVFRWMTLKDKSGAQFLQWECPSLGDHHYLWKSLFQGKIFNFQLDPWVQLLQSANSAYLNQQDVLGHTIGHDFVRSDLGKDRHTLWHREKPWWDTFIFLVEKGLDLSIQNHAGQSVFDVLLGKVTLKELRLQQEKLHAKNPEQANFIEYLLVQGQQHTLRQTTPVVKISRASPRL